MYRRSGASHFCLATTAGTLKGPATGTKPPASMSRKSAIRTTPETSRARLQNRDAPQAIASILCSEPVFYSQSLNPQHI